MWGVLNIITAENWTGGTDRTAKKNPENENQTENLEVWKKERKNLRDITEKEKKIRQNENEYAT